MSSLDQAILAERAAAVERHLKRLKSCLPKDIKDFLRARMPLML